jgi:DNA polymerase-3 subunit gamma/tau
VDLGRSLDIIEVDGASTRGIDDIRELRENVRYAPTSGRTKVYIIDEVHMLTREAFNALLKTLEEPPPHVVFVMATTEPFKVPATILSRCQRFDFARIHPKAVVDRLTRIVEAEGFKVQPDALALLARRSQGGLRDALSTLDQVLASSDEEVTVELVNRVLGILGSDFYVRLTDHLIDGDARGALQLVDEVYHAGADLEELAEELARHLRNLMLLSIGREMEPVLEELGPAEIVRLREQAERISTGTVARMLETMLRMLNDVTRGEHLRLHLEVALVEIAALSRSVPIPELLRRLEELERRLNPGGTGAGSSGAAPAAPAGGASGRRNGEATRSGAAAASRTSSAEAPPPPAAARVPVPGLREPAALAGSQAEGPMPQPVELPALWQRLTGEVKQRKMALGAFLIGSRCRGFDREGRLIVEVDAEHAFYKTNLESDDNRRFIEGVVREVFGRSLGYTVLVGGSSIPAGAEDHEPGRQAGAPSGRVEAAPAPPEDPPEERPPAAPQKPRKSPVEIAQSDENVKRVMELFDGEITS